jgi:hypothetical protein
VGRERKASAAPAEAAARLTIAQPTTAPPDWRYGRTQCPRPRAALTWGAAVARGSAHDRLGVPIRPRRRHRRR